MTDREIQQACLDAYTDVIDNLPDDFDEALDFLKVRNLEDGLCYYAFKNLDIWIIGDGWVEREVNTGRDSLFWFRPHVCVIM